MVTVHQTEPGLSIKKKKENFSSIINLGLCYWVPNKLKSIILLVTMQNYLT